MGAFLTVMVCAAATPLKLQAQCQKSYTSGANLSLTGNWLFMKGNPPGASSSELAETGWASVPVPGQWNKIADMRNYADDGWYRCHIELSGHPDDGLALFLGRIEDADAAYFNGTLIGQTGSLTSPIRVDTEKSRLYSLPGHLWREGDNVIAVHIRGSTGGAGFYEPPEIVNESARIKQLILTDVPAIAFSCVYILVAGFFGLFFVFFLNKKENLYFSLFSLFLGLYHLMRSWVRYSLFDSFELSYQFELFVLFLLPPIFLRFLIHLIKIPKPGLVKIFELYYALIFFTLLVSTIVSRKPATWSMLVRANLLGMVFALGLTAWIVKTNYAEKKQQLQYLILGFVCLAPAVLHDMMQTLRIINTPRVTVYAFLFFLGFVSLQLSDSILWLYRHLEDQEKELRQVEKKKTHSIFNISNEFRVIFEGMKEAISDSLKKETAKKRNADPEERVRTAIVNLENMLNDSNLLTLLELREYTVRRVRFSLRKLSQDVIDQALTATRQNRKRLMLDLPEEGVEVIGDPDLLSATLYHLVENALLYTKGQVEISVEKDSEQLIYMVRDEGPGLNADQQKMLFEKFVRGVDDSSEIPGIGIGLTIVDLIAKRLDGSVKIESGAGFFSTFAFRVPLSAMEAAA